MDSKTVFEYLTEAMKWTSIGSVSYLAALMGATGLPGLFSDRIKTQEELDKIAHEEAKKLGLTKKVKAYLADELGASAQRWSNESYEISVGGFCANRQTVRHELYHIHKGHCDNRPKNPVLNRLDYLFRREPQAVAYEFFGLKL